MKKEIKNLRKTADRILKAINNKEKIVLFGDSDLDGISSVIILKETIKNLGGEITAVYFPDREEEGYGISENALNFLKTQAPALLIVMDCGITNFEEAILAKQIGFELIIIDHHEILGRLPEASIIVDPKQEEDKYPFKELATTGIIYRLSQILLDEISDALRADFLELTALATIADMMQETDENKMFIEQGLSSLKDTWRPGLRIFWNMDNIRDCENVRQAAQKIISILNAGENENHLHETYKLLVSSSLEEAKNLAKKLVEKNYKKKARTADIFNYLEEKIETRLNTLKKDESIIFEEYSSLPLPLAGAVASRICNKFQKPTFIFKKKGGESLGTVRMPQGFDAVDAMTSCKRLLKTYGGHPLAAGFRTQNENIEKFKQCLIKYFAKE